jgi:predicted DNA-binding protein with PD1-like motif
MTSTDKHFPRNDYLSVAFINGRCISLDMARVQVVESTGRIVIARLEPGEDILHSIENIATERELLSAHVSMIGAVSKVHLGYFDRAKKEYKDFTLEEDLEIVSGVGNISRHGDKYVVHAHIVAADETGRCYGGHLLEGCEVSVTIELVISEVTELKRSRDNLTGLNLLDI